MPFKEIKDDGFENAKSRGTTKVALGPLGLFFVAFEDIQIEKARSVKLSLNTTGSLPR